MIATHRDFAGSWHREERLFVLLVRCLDAGAALLREDDALTPAEQDRLDGLLWLLEIARDAIDWALPEPAEVPPLKATGPPLTRLQRRLRDLADALRAVADGGRTRDRRADAGHLLALLPLLSGWIQKKR